MTKGKSPPVVKARVRASPGLLNEILDSVAEEYRTNNPDRDVRFVYAPEDSQHYSKVLMRSAQGYVPVDADEVHMPPHGHTGSLVRVGDVMMMSIPRETREEIIEEKNRLARAELDRLQAEFYEEVSNIRAGRHQGRPTGEIRVHSEQVQLKFPTGGE